MAVRSPRFIELCAGVGGLGLGVKLAEPDSRCVAYVEREAYAAAVLVARMAAGDLDSAPVWSELATFDPRPWRGAVDCVISGDPCQPNSIAGNQQGHADERFLVEHVIRVFDQCGAGRLFRENVTGNADGQLAALVPALESLGCTVAAGIFAASEVGASHRRERLFVMADRDVGRLQGVGQPQPAGVECPPRHVADRCSLPGQAVDYAMRDRHGDQVETLRAGRHGADHAGELLADAHGARGAIGESNPATRHQGHSKIAVDSGGREFPFAPAADCASWPDLLEAAPGLEPAICRVANGVPDRVDRLRACGGAAVPLVAAYAWVSLSAVLASARGAGAAVLTEGLAA